MTSHSFSVELASKIGIEKAILLQHFYFWHQRNEANNKHLHDEHYWTYNTVKAFNEIFPYISEKKIYSLLKGLEKDGYILTGNYNKIKFDRTKWYALTDKSLSIFLNGKMELPKEENPTPETGEPIPDINPDLEPSLNKDSFPKNEFSGFDSKFDKKEKKESKKGIPPKKPKTDPLFQPFRKLFEEAYNRITGAQYYWQVKDSVAINNLIKQVRYAYQTSNNPVPEPTQQQMIDGFAHILKRAEKDKWMVSNFETTIINSKFNNLKNIKNGTASEKSDQLLQDAINIIRNKHK